MSASILYSELSKLVQKFDESFGDDEKRKKITEEIKETRNKLADFWNKTNELPEFVEAQNFSNEIQEKMK